MKILQTALYTMLTVLLLSIAGVFLASMLPIPGHIAIKIVKSGSMEPTIHTGSIVIIKPAGSYEVGDVVTFGADTKTQIPTTHRIINIESNNGITLYTTKGDANDDPDTNKIKTGDIHGTVIASIPGAGYVLAFAKTPLGFGLLIGLPAAIIILDELFKIIGEVRNMYKSKKPEDRLVRMSSSEVDVQDLQQMEPHHIPTHKSMDGIRPHTRNL